MRAKAGKWPPCLHERTFDGQRTSERLCLYDVRIAQIGWADWSAHPIRRARFMPGRIRMRRGAVIVPLPLRPQDVTCAEVRFARGGRLLAWFIKRKEGNK